MTLRPKIAGTGMCVPDRVVTNDDLAKLMETSDEWIRQRSGIVERRFIEPGQMPADLARAASERALEAAGLEARDLDCIVLATLSAQAEFPGTSFFLHEALGADEVPCFDLRAQCSGFVYSLSVAKSFVESGQFRRVLVVIAILLVVVPVLAWLFRVPLFGGWIEDDAAVLVYDKYDIWVIPTAGGAA